MQKNTFYSILFCLTLGGYAAIEASSTYSDEAVRNAELQQEEVQQPVKPDYVVSVTMDSIKVIDPETGKTILSESYDSKSTLSKAILKDNQ